MCYATNTIRTGVLAENNFWLVTNKCSAARDSFLFVGPCFTLPFTVSTVKCQTVCDLPTGAVHAIQKVFQTFAHKLWVGKETSDKHAPPRGTAIHSYLGAHWILPNGFATQPWENGRHFAVIYTNAPRVCWQTSPDEEPTYVWWCNDLSAEKTGAAQQQQSSGQLSPLSYSVR